MTPAAHRNPHRPRQEQERAYWNEAALDPHVDTKYISDIPANWCLWGIKPFLTRGPTLEIGCGVGRLCEALRPSYDVIGLDISRNMLEEARRRHRGSYILGDGRTIPVRPKSLQNIYSVLVFQHLPYDAVHQYIAEAGRALRPGGMLRFQYIEGDEHEPFSQHHHRSDIQYALVHSGFTIVDIESGFAHKDWTWIAATTSVVA